MTDVNELIQDLEDVIILKNANVIIAMCDILIDNKSIFTIKHNSYGVFICINTTKFYGSLIISDDCIKLSILKRAVDINALDHNSIEAFIMFDVLKEKSYFMYNVLMDRANKIKNME